LDVRKSKDERLLRSRDHQQIVNFGGALLAVGRRGFAGWRRPPLYAVCDLAERPDPAIYSS
jgi:hypothetical protein